MALFNPNDPRLQRNPGANSQFTRLATSTLQQNEGQNPSSHVHTGHAHLTEAPSHFEVMQPQASPYRSAYQTGLLQAPPQMNGHSSSGQGQPGWGTQSQQAGYKVHGATMQGSYSSGIPQGNRPSGWSTGAFDCFSFCDATCVQTCFIPYVTYGQNYARVNGDEDSCASQCILFYFLSCLGPGLPALLLGGPSRANLRIKYNLAEDPCNDCLLHWCCTPCALCQEARELDLRDASAVHNAASYQVPQQQKMVT